MFRNIVTTAVLMTSAANAASPNDQTILAVRVVTSDADRKSCEYLGLVSVRKAMGPNKAGGALKKALEHVAQMGGNGLFLINQSQNWVDGASVSGEALRCPQKHSALTK